MKKFILVLAMVGFALFVPTQAHAIFISTGDTIFGADSVTQDTVGGLEWLDLTLSVNRSYNDMVGVDGTNEFIAGGDFAGWRHSTLTETSDMFANLGFPDIGVASAANVPFAETFYSLFGTTLTRTDGSRRSIALNATQVFGTNQNCPLVDVVADGSVAQATVFTGCDPTQSLSYVGNWLVRDLSSTSGGNAVPEPMSMMLFGTGLVGAAIRKRFLA